MDTITGIYICTYSIQVSIDWAENARGKHSGKQQRSMVGILVHGSNHFIVRGPRPSREIALALTRHWTLIQIGTATPAALNQWTITPKEFRENLKWAVILTGEQEVSPAVQQILDELKTRGVAVDDFTNENPTNTDKPKSF